MTANAPGHLSSGPNAYAHGRQVVDPWAGDEVSGDTLTGVYSSTKGAAESFADPVNGIAFGYTRRRFGFGWSYPEHERLAAAVHRAATAS